MRGDNQSVRINNGCSTRVRALGCVEDAVFCVTLRLLSVTLFCLSALVSATPGHAQMYKCNGTWTNRPCEGAVEGRIEAAPAREAPERSDAAPADSKTAPPSANNLEPLAPRLDLIRKLRKVSDDYKRKGGIALSKQEMDGFKVFCEDRSNPYVDCLQKFNEFSSRLVSQNQAEERNQIEAERNQIEASKVDAINRSGRGVQRPDRR